MTLPIPPVNDWQDIQYAFDAIATRFPLSAKDLANDSVTAAQIAAGGVGTSELATGIVLQLATTGTTRKVAFGSTTLTWTAAALSATQTVTHGLGTTPSTVLVTAQQDAGGHLIVANLTAAPGATTFSLRGVFYDNTVLTTTATVFWAAVG